MAIPIGTPRPCKGCGNIILKSKFCSGPCRAGWYARTEKDRRPYQRIEQPIINCSHCGAEFRRFNAQGSLCSNACKMAAWKVRNLPDYTSPEVRKEAKALRWIARRAPVAIRRLRAIRAKIDALKLRQGHACADCGLPISGENLRIRFCPACADQRNKAHKRISRHTGRMRLRTATVERFDPVEVLERDGWRCHLCGKKTPRRLRGTYDDRAPELDHIVPLAAGGEHSRRNTACACRKCNIAKSDKPLGQMRLVA